jgi:hypothetical protein
MEAGRQIASGSYPAVKKCLDGEEARANVLSREQKGKNTALHMTIISTQKEG